MSILKGWLPGPWERHIWVVKLAKVWEKIYISKGQRKNLRLEVFWSKCCKKRDIMLRKKPIYDSVRLRAVLRLSWSHYHLMLPGSKIQNSRWNPSNLSLFCHRPLARPCTAILDYLCLHFFILLPQSLCTLRFLFLKGSSPRYLCVCLPYVLLGFCLGEACPDYCI